MNLDAPNINFFWSTLLVEELVRSGCRHFVVAPGSRSTPLAGAVALNTRATHTVTFDERSAGFFALGHAKASGWPAAVIVTSGTAVANLMPAVVEAHMDRIPLIILSADRPWELRDVEANQTINQTNFFGAYANWFFELPCPDDTIPPTMLLSSASYSVYRSRHPVAGPVQLNCLYREPLAPIEGEFKRDVVDLNAWLHSPDPCTHYDFPITSCSQDGLNAVASKILEAKQGLLVIGAVKDRSACRPLLHLGQSLGWPIFADLASGLRQVQDPLIIRYGHHVLLNPQAHNLEFDVVLQVGGRLISKTLEQFLSARVGQAHILVDNHPKRSDASLSVTHRLDGDLEIFARELAAMVATKKTRPSDALSILNRVSQRVEKHIESIVGEDLAASEPYVARQISQSISPNAMLMACTSMPIRDYHMFAVCRADGGPHIIVNRGASGIDGLMSTAMGFAQASKKRSTVLIGDLAFMHDANALAMLSQLAFPMCIVVINNQGGGIFSFLPIAKFPTILTPFIDTPHDHDLSGLARAFGVTHVRVVTKGEFDKAYAEAQQGGSHVVIEVASERQANYLLHERIRQVAAESS